MGKFSARQVVGFVVPSVVGILLFMVPIQVDGSWTIAVKVVADDPESLLGMITCGGFGGFVLGDLLTVLVIIFALAGLLLPLLLDFGLLEFIGALLTIVMRPLFTIPGRAAVGCVTSLIGEGALGVMLAANQYEGGYYSAREASIVSTTFSAVSITFSIVVLAQVDLMDYFGLYYLLICMVGIVCALILPRIPPLRWKKDECLVEGKAMAETLPELFVLFLERTIISLLVVCPLAHLLF